MPSPRPSRYVPVTYGLPDMGGRCDHEEWFCRGLRDRLPCHCRRTGRPRPARCRPRPARCRAGPGPGAAGGAAQHIKKIQHVRKAHSSYAIFAVLDEIDVLSSQNVTGDRNLPGKPKSAWQTGRRPADGP